MAGIRLFVLACYLASATSRVLHQAPAAAPAETERWAVVLDAGSTGTRVAVFKFVSPGLDATKMDLDLYSLEKTKPGLSAYAGQPAQVAASLAPLIQAARAAIPETLQASTTISLAATAGLRLLPGSQADEILAAVRAYLETETPFVVTDVEIIDGQSEGAYAWGQANYLLGRLGLPAEDTLAIVDMGGGSMQQTFAMTDAEAAAAPPNSTYVLKLESNGTLPIDYNLYSHSYLGFGSKAARAAVLSASEATGEMGNPCVPLSANTTFEYVVDEVKRTFEVLPVPEGPSAAACAAAVAAALRPDAPCGVQSQEQCTFQGEWGGNPPKNVVIMSTFWYVADDGGLIPANATQVEVTPADFASVAQAACETPLEQYPEVFPKVDEESAPFFCLDASYVASVLTKGFSFAPDQTLTLVDSVLYDMPTGTEDAAQDVDMGWTLGAALRELLGIGAVYM